MMYRVSLNQTMFKMFLWLTLSPKVKCIRIPAWCLMFLSTMVCTQYIQGSTCTLSEMYSMDLMN